MGAGLDLVDELATWDSILNAFPDVVNAEELAQAPSVVLGRRFGAPGRVIGSLPGVRGVVWRRLRRDRRSALQLRGPEAGNERERMTATANDAGRRRVRRVFATGLSSGLARLASFGVTLVAVPLVIRELGAEQYGVYVSLAALVGILLAVDLGLGSALVTRSRNFRTLTKSGIGSGAWLPPP